MGIMNNYIIKIKNEDWAKKNLDQVFQKKMQKIMEKFNDFILKKKITLVHELFRRVGTTVRSN